jgi:hypothetical protein
VFVGALNETARPGTFGTREAEPVVGCFLLAIQLMVADWNSIAR